MIRWRLEAPLMAALFLDLLGFGMILADFQLRAAKMMPTGWPTGLVIGAMLASTFLIQILVSPKWGTLGDRVGHKPALIACSVLSAAAMLVYGFAGSILLLLASRVLAGLGGANVAVAQALVTDELEEEDRTPALGRIGAAISAGLIVGPVIGGFLAVAGSNSLVGLVGGAASLTGAIVLWLTLPNPKPREQGPLQTPPLFQFGLLREIPGLSRLALIASVAWFSLAMLEGTFARLINLLYNYDQREFGILFGYEALLGVVVQGVALTFIRKRIADMPLLRVALLLQGGGLLLNPLAGYFQALVVPMAVLFVASTLFAIGGAVSNPTINSACSVLTPKDRQGELFGVLQASRSIGFLAGPVLGGLLFDFLPAAPYLIAFLVCVGASFLVPSRLQSSNAK